MDSQRRLVWTPRTRCVRFVFGVAAASRNSRFQAARYGLIWVGLAPTDRASFAWRLPSLDHLVGERQHVVGEFDPERLRGLEVDHEFEFARLHDRQVGRCRAFENPAGTNTALTVALGEVRCVTDETACFRKFTLRVHGRQLVARSKRNELIAMAGEERV